MKLVAQVQLLPDAETARSLRDTVERFNAACNWVAGAAFDRRLANRIELQKVVYRDVRDRFGLSAQMTCLCIRRVCEAYKRDRSVRPCFAKLAAMPFDQRTMNFRGVDRVSLLTLTGRVVVPYLIGKYHEARMTYPKGQADLVRRKDGKWFLIVTVNVPEVAPIPVTDFLGVDLGIANIATDSDLRTKPHTGKRVEDVRRKHNIQRKRLQRRNTKGAKKKLKRVAGKEARFRRHENHCVSKILVETAKRTGRGIALEDLKGIRERVTARGGDARNRLSGWSFGQLVASLSYKAQRAGVPVVFVDPRYTSQTCAECGHRERSNRKNQSEFVCKACGHKDHADKNAALVQAGALAVPCNAATGLDNSLELSRKAARL